MPTFLTIKSCNLITKEAKRAALVVHSLGGLLADNKSIPSKPHRHTFYQILYVEKGAGIHKIDFQDYPIKNRQLFFIAPGQVHNLQFEEASAGLLINFDEGLFSEFLARPEDIDHYPFFNKDGKYSSYQLRASDEAVLASLQRIWNSENLNLQRIYLLELLTLINQKHHEQVADEVQTTAQDLVRRFEKLIENNYDLHHYPKYYARELFVTPNYLNAVCKKVRHYTAGELIRQRIVLEIKRLLSNSQLSISEISYLTGFEDKSYFTKFFKQNTGKTPRQFRQEI